MTPVSIKLAHRTATTAVPFVESLAQDYSDVAHTLRTGQLREALDTFDGTVERLRRFLTFLVVASEMINDQPSPTAAAMNDYSARVFQVLDGVEDSLSRRDLLSLTMILEHGLATILLEYRTHASEVIQALAPHRQVA